MPPSVTSGSASCVKFPFNDLIRLPKHSFIQLFILALASEVHAQELKTRKASGIDYRMFLEKANMSILATALYRRFLHWRWHLNRSLERSILSQREHVQDPYKCHVQYCVINCFERRGWRFTFCSQARCYLPEVWQQRSEHHWQKGEPVPAQLPTELWKAQYFFLTTFCYCPGEYNH